MIHAYLNPVLHDYPNIQTSECILICTHNMYRYIYILQYTYYIPTRTLKKQKVLKILH